MNKCDYHNEGLVYRILSQGAPSAKKRTICVDMVEQYIQFTGLLYTYYKNSADTDVNVYITLFIIFRV